MDYNMPNMNGYECSKTILENPKFNKIIVIGNSAGHCKNVINSFKSVGVNHFFEKPI